MAWVVATFSAFQAMIPSDISSRLAVCSWSLRPESPDDLVARLAETGIVRVQLEIDKLRDHPEVWGNCAEVFAAHGISIVSGMFGTVGEDYSTLETIKATGGIVPDETWEENWSNIQATVEIAAKLGMKLVTFHAGFLPHDTSDPVYLKLRQRITRIAGLFSGKGIDLAFETGQEDAPTLAAFLTDLGMPGVGVNFDPANMILYAKGDPVAALRTLRPWLKQCHIKDATQTKVPGTWGAEVPTGTGEVDWNGFFAVLAETGYTGDFCIEREAGTQRVEDIRAAREFLTKPN
jgi:L-ribulose-5-phosphate 3-epimerase